ncbi:MAG: hypothetical protein N2C14_33455, partial [Planctomycetales bacterium]
MRRLAGIMLLAVACQAGFIGNAIGEDPTGNDSSKSDASESDSSANDGSESKEAPRLDPVPMPEAKRITQSIDRGIAFLLADQNKNGSWGTAQQTKGLNIYAPVPGAHHAFRAAVTSLCVSALIETGSDRKDVAESLDRAEQWM